MSYPKNEFLDIRFSDNGMAVGPEQRRGFDAFPHRCHPVCRSRASSLRTARSLLHAHLLCCCPCPLWPRSTAGRILGTVTDQSGAAVAGATVTVTDTQRGTSRTFTTDASGDYAAPDLQPGTYKIHVEAKGFKSVGAAQRVRLKSPPTFAPTSLCKPGQVTEIVTVTEEVPLFNTTSATLGGTLSNKEINDLPLNGRNYENLLQLRPGVMRYPGGGFSTTSTNGLRAEDNAYFIEGLFNSEPFSGQGIINGAGIAGDSATILPIDAIQEFNLQENPPAEYGWKPGAVVNVGLKSGTNALHGTAFAFGRDGALDARNYFNAAPAPENSAHPGTVWRQPGRRRSLKTRLSSSAPTKASATTWATRSAAHHALDGSRCPPPAQTAFLRCVGRLRQQHPECDRRSCKPDGVPHQRRQPDRFQAAASLAPPSPAMAPASLSTTRRASTLSKDFQTMRWRRQRAGQSRLQLQSAQQHQRHVFLRKQLRHRGRLSRAASQVALQDSHPRSGGRRQLDLDSQHSLGE